MILIFPANSGTLASGREAGGRRRPLPVLPRDEYDLRVQFTHAFEQRNKTVGRTLREVSRDKRLLTFPNCEQLRRSLLFNEHLANVTLDIRDKTVECLTLPEVSKTDRLRALVHGPFIALDRLQDGAVLAG